MSHANRARRAKPRWALAKMAPERLREMTVTREAEVERESAQVRLTRVQPRERLLHADPQQVLVDCRAGLGPEHAREMKWRYPELGGHVRDPMRRIWRRHERALHRHGERAPVA